MSEQIETNYHNIVDKENLTPKDAFNFQESLEKNLDSCDDSDKENNPSLTIKLCDENFKLPNNFAYQYKMRKPVESWKYIETQREDGQNFFTCRICYSSYKHKKSLNKHWRDKHASVPRPENAGDESSEESEDNTSETESIQIPLSSIENKIGNVNQHTPRSSLSIKRERDSPDQLDKDTQNTQNKENSSGKRRNSMIPIQEKRKEPTTDLNNNNNNNINTNLNLNQVTNGPNPLGNIFQNIFSEYLKNQISIDNSSNNIQDQQKKLLSPRPLDLTTNEQVELLKNSQIIKNINQPNNSKPINISLIKIILQTLLNNMETETASYYNELSSSTANLLKSLKIILADFDETMTTRPQETKPSSPQLPQNSLILQATNLLNQNAQSLLGNTNFIPVTTQNQPPPQINNPFTNFLNQNQNIFSLFQGNSTPQNNINLRVPIPPTPENLKPRRHTMAERKPRPLQPRKSFTPGETKSNNNSTTLDDSNQMNGDQNGPISCPLCSYEARWFSELRAHMVNHSDHRMFGCCYCNYRAKWKWDVAKHMRRCALARHVAHMPNEGLLRMVKYFAPPEGDVLFSYFPKSGYPGVGVDKPISPPPYMLNNHTNPESENQSPQPEMSMVNFN